MSYAGLSMRVRRSINVNKCGFDKRSANDFNSHSSDDVFKLVSLVFIYLDCIKVFPYSIKHNGLSMRARHSINGD